MNILDVKDLTMEYDGKNVFKNLNFALKKGEFLCVVGKNGAGKTTLIKGILGLKKPKSGKVGKNYSKAGYLPQKILIKQDFPASVLEVVQFPTKFFVTKKDKVQALAVLNEFGMKDLARSTFALLSGGQQQRVLLARAFNYSKDILVLDEPVSGLDPNVTKEFYTLVKGLNTSVVMVTHDIKGALAYGDKILYLGEHTFFGSKEEYLNSGVGFDA